MSVFRLASDASSSEGRFRGGYKVGEVDDKVPSKHSELDTGKGIG